MAPICHLTPLAESRPDDGHDIWRPCSGLAEIDIEPVLRELARRAPEEQDRRWVLFSCSSTGGRIAPPLAAVTDPGAVGGVDYQKRFGLVGRQVVLLVP